GGKPEEYAGVWGDPLPAEAAAGHGDEHRVGEATLLVAHHQHAVATAPAGKERDLGEVGNDRNAVSALQQAIGNRLVARCAQLFQNLTRGQEAPLLARLRVSTRAGPGQDDTG